MSGRVWLRLGALLLLLTFVATGLAIRQLYADALYGAQRHATALALVVAEHTARDFRAVDRALKDIRTQLAQLAPEQLGDRALHERLAAHRDSLPYVAAFALVRSDGQMANSSRPWPPAAVGAVDRDFFTHFRDHDDPGLFVSAPMLSRGGGTWSIFLARRLATPQGGFAGVLVGLVELRHFSEFYGAVGLPEAVRVTLLRRDGVLLARYPDAPQPGRRMPASSPWFDMVATGGGTYWSPGFFASGDILVAARPIEAYPLVLDVTMEKRAVLATWKRQAVMLSLGAAAAAMCAALLGVAVRSQLRSTERERTRSEQRAAALDGLGARLRQESRLLQTTLDHMDQGLMMIGADGRVEICNRRAIAMLDLPEAMMAARPSFAEVVTLQWQRGEFAATEERLQALFRTDGLLGVPQTYERARPDGTILEVRSVPLADGGVVRTYADITLRKQNEERVRYLAHHDDLTRLLNRPRFNDRLDEAVAGRDLAPFALFYLDLDFFKEVNDTHGHPVGDALLQRVAERLVGTMRRGDTVARMGGDEFCIIMRDVSSAAAAAAMAQRLLRVVVMPYDIGRLRLTIGLSVGIACCPAHGATSQALMGRADTALYAAKAAGRNRVVTYDPDDPDCCRKEAAIEGAAAG